MSKFARSICAAAGLAIFGAAPATACQYNCPPPRVVTPAPQPGLYPKPPAQRLIIPARPKHALPASAAAVKTEPADKAAKQ